MTLSNKLILGQISLYVFALILSFCLTLPLLLHLSSFDGHCLLFSGGSWQEDDGLLNIKWSSKFYCVFPIITGFLIFILSGAMIYRLTKLYHKEEESSFLGLFFDAFCGFLLVFSTLVSAIFITLGFIRFCDLMSQRFPTCETADGQNITKPEVKIRTNGFYTQMGVAQFAGWSNVTTWVGLSTFAVLKLVNNHQLRNLRVSMYLERQRLVNEDSFRENLSDVPQRDSLSDWAQNT